MSSSRLPGKVLLPVSGVPLAILAARRAGNRKREVLLATSSDASDSPLVEMAESAGVDVMRGDLVDVLGRFVEATKDLSDDDWVVRLTADNVFPDGDFIDEFFQLVGSGYEYASLDQSSCLPYGVIAEGVKVSALRRAHREVPSGRQYDREHVTPWIRRNCLAQQVRLLDTNESWGRLRATCDTPFDFERLSRIFSGLSAEDAGAISWRELAGRLEQVTDANEPVFLAPHCEPKYPALVLGTAQLGQIAYGATNQNLSCDIERDRCVVDRALRLGVRRFDTASGYGGAEALLGDSLCDHKVREGIHITTKLSSFEGNSEGGESLGSRLDNEMFQSLSRLKVNRLDAVLLHNAADLGAVGGRVWSRLQYLKSSAVIGEVGVSVYTPDEALAAVAAGCDVVQLPANIFDLRWENEEVIEALAKIRVAVRSVFLQGILVNPLSAWPEALRAPEMGGAEVVTCLDDLVASFGLSSRLELCLAWAKSIDWIDEVVVGAEVSSQIEELARLYADVRLLSIEERALARNAVQAVGMNANLGDPRSWANLEVQA